MQPLEEMISKQAKVESDKAYNEAHNRISQIVREFAGSQYRPTGALVTVDQLLFPYRAGALAIRERTLRENLLKAASCMAGDV